MKFIHLSDLHLGKRLNEYSLLEDQEHILNEILKIADREQPDAAVIAGDVYDRSMASAEALKVFEQFVYALADRKIPVLVIPGNHDSAQHLSFGSRLMEAGGVHIAPSYDGTVRPVVLTDGYGPVYFWLLPFLRPYHVRAAWPDDPCGSYAEAVASALSHLDLDPAARNVLVTHQFVTGAATCDSEESVGGTENIPAEVFDVFDYTALGHLHGPQSITDKIRYCGTPLKYSFSEMTHQKSVTVVELKEKGDLTVRTVPLPCLRDMKEIRGTYNEITAFSYYQTLDREDYYRVILTDEEDVPGALARLRTVYPNIMELRYDNLRSGASGVRDAVADRESKTPLELFEEFFRLQNNSGLSEEQRALCEDLIRKIWREDEDATD